jgi:hypothetical protein
VPDNWQPTSHFLEKDTSTASEKQPGSGTGAENYDDFPTCYIEEEIPEEMASQAATTEAGHTLDTGTGSGEDEGAGGEQQGEAVPSEAEENRLGGTTREGGKVLSPPPISSMHEQWRVPPPFLHPGAPGTLV